MENSYFNSSVAGTGCQSCRRQFHRRSESGFLSQNQLNSPRPSSCGRTNFSCKYQFSSWTDVLLLLLINASLVAPAVLPPIQRRWLFPCNGGAPMVQVAPHPDDVSAAASSTNLNAPSPVEVADNLHTISTKANRLKRHIRELKDLYVQQRFRDNSIVQDLEQMGIRLVGMPDATESTINSVSNIDMTESVHRAFEHLARVAVFIDQARLGESLAVNEPVSYERHFERLEDHHDHGLYWLLCAVQGVLRQTRQPIASEVVDAVQRMRVVEVDRNSMRHTRDYLVLRDFERVLERVSVEFAALSRAHNPRQRHTARRRAAITPSAPLDDGSGSAA